MVDSLTPFEALELLVARAKSQSALGRALGVSQAAVWKWLQSSKRLPAEYVLDAERLYGVSRHDLRHDLHPRGLAPAPDTFSAHDPSGDDPEAADPATRVDIVPDDHCAPLALSPSAARSPAAHRTFSPDAPSILQAADTDVPAGPYASRRGAPLSIGEAAS